MSEMVREQIAMYTDTPRHVDNILAIPGLREEAENQDLPEVPRMFVHDISISLSVFDTYTLGQHHMLTPDADGNVWVKVKPKEVKGGGK